MIKDMAPLPTLSLARLIVKNYMRDDFNLVIVDGNLRKGKTTYAVKSVEQALDYLGKIHTDEIQPSELKWILGFEPDEVLESWLFVKVRQPAFVWDDAGYWLHSMNWRDPVMVSIQQYFNVVGTDFNTMILTTPSPLWVLSKIANMPEMIRVKITKRDGGNRDSEYKRFARTATAYQRWTSPDLKRGGVNKIWVDTFSCKMRDSLYEWYKPIRDEYAFKAKQAILKNWRNKTDRDQLDELKTTRRLRKLQKELFGEDAPNHEVMAT